MSRLLVAVAVCVGVVLVSSVAMGQAKVGTGALLLDGLDDFVDLEATLIGDTSFTIEAWMNSTETGGWILGNNEISDLRHLTSPGGPSGPLGSVICLQYKASGVWKNTLSDGDNPAVDDGVWHHVAAVYDRTDAAGGFMTLYIDGAKSMYVGLIWGVLHLDPNPVPGPADLGFQAIGRMTDSAGSTFGGMIDELVILDIALDAAGVAAHYNGGAGVSMTAAEPGLVAGWHFDVDATDFSGNGYHGELMNGASITQVEACGDFDDSGGPPDCVDIDMLAAVLNTTVPPTDAMYDLVVDGAIDNLDWIKMIEVCCDTKLGDAELDGDVDLQDFNKLAVGFNQPGGWCSGDFDGSQFVDLGDFNKLAVNFGWVRP